MGCNGEGEVSTPDAADPSEVEDPAPTQSLRFATFNLGLAVGYVPHAEARLEPAVAAVASVDADVLCLQEIWLLDQVDYVATQLATRFGHVYYEYVQEEVSGEAPCTEEEGAPLAACAQEHCAEETEIANCVLTNCLDEYTATSANCQQCMAAHIDVGDIAEIFATCTVPAASTTYGGHQGLMMASKYPIENREYIYLDAVVSARGVLYGEVQGVQIACTHLTTDLPSPEYAGDHVSYQGENQYQIDTVLTFLDAKQNTAPQVFIGDFNVGPALEGGIVAEFGENYASMEAAEFTNANVDSDVPFCTWCVANKTGSTESDLAIDHILVRQAEVSEPQRLFDELISIESPDADTDALEVHLSDHFGVGSTVTWRP